MLFLIPSSVVIYQFPAPNETDLSQRSHTAVNIKMALIYDFARDWERVHYSDVVTINNFDDVKTCHNWRRLNSKVTKYLKLISKY